MCYDLPCRLEVLHMRECWMLIRHTSSYNGGCTTISFKYFGEMITTNYFKKLTTQYTWTHSCTLLEASYALYVCQEWSLLNYMQFTHDVLTSSAVGLLSTSFCRHASTNEQNSSENWSLGGVGVGSYNIWHDKNKWAVKINWRTEKLN